MLKVYSIVDKMEYLDEVALLEYNEWANDKESNREERIESKKNIIKDNLNNNSFCKLILLKGNTLVGFISMFPTDGEEEKELSPWYATMYVKEEYRGKGYSKRLNDALLYEAAKRGFDTLYLKTALINYYEKFGAKYIKDLSNGEKLYQIKTNSNIDKIDLISKLLFMTKKF